MAKLKAILTADICDKYGDDVEVAEPIFNDYGEWTAFHGPIVTVKTVDDFSQVRKLLRGKGSERVLVVDGAGSLSHALMGGNLAAAAAENGWAGAVFNGCIRDVAELDALAFGVKALGSCPRRPMQNDQGLVDVPVTFAGVTFRPGDWLYADRDGLLVAAGELSL